MYPRAILGYATAKHRLGSDHSLGVGIPFSPQPGRPCRGRVCLGRVTINFSPQQQTETALPLLTGSREPDRHEAVEHGPNHGCEEPSPVVPDRKIHRGDLNAEQNT